MAGEFELAVSRIVSRARLLETALHGRGVWEMVVYGAETECRMPAARQVIEDEYRVSFVAYAPVPCPGIHTVELYLNGGLVMTRLVEPIPDAPCRIMLDVGIEDPEVVR